MSLAAIEAVKAKRILGALRALWRSSPQGGHDQRVTHLKTFLLSSPNRRAGREAAAEAPAPPPLAAAPQVVDESEGEDEGNAAAADDDAPHDHVEDGSDGDASPPTSPCSERGGSSDGLTATTL